MLLREMITVCSENDMKHTYCVVTLYQVVYVVTTVLYRLQPLRGTVSVHLLWFFTVYPATTSLHILQTTVIISFPLFS